MTGFHTEFLCAPREWSEEDRRADAAAEEYESRCEWFDREVCVARNERGIAIPTLPGELGEINRHAMVVRKDVRLRHGVTGKALHEALWRMRRTAA